MAGEWDLPVEEFQTLQNLLSQIPEEELSAPALPPDPGYFNQDTVNQDFLNQEYFQQEYLNQDYCSQDYFKQEYLEQRQQICHGDIGVTIKKEAEDWWSAPPLPHSPAPAPAPATNIHAHDPLPQSPSSWEEYSFNFEPITPSPQGSPSSGPPSSGPPSSGPPSSGPPSSGPPSSGPPPTAPSTALGLDSHSVTISRRNGPQGKGDVIRKMRRREQNRVAAQRCRNKKKHQNQQTIQEFQELQKSHDRLQVEVDYLEKERRRLERILQEHLKDCSQAASPARASQ